MGSGDQRAQRQESHAAPDMSVGIDFRPDHGGVTAVEFKQNPLKQD